MQATWHDCTLGDLICVKHGYAFKGEFFGTLGTHIVLTPGNFYETGGFKKKGDKEKWYSGSVPNEYVLCKGDLIVAMTEQGEGLLGSSALVPQSGFYLHNQRLGLVTQNDASVTDKEFLYYLFNSRSVRQQIRASANGAKIRHTSPTRMYEVKVRVPHVVAQRRIASILSAYDDLIENNTRRIAILEEMASRLYEEWFVRFRFPGHEGVRMVESELGLVPQGWDVVRLDQVLVLQRGFDLPKQDRIEGRFPIISSTGSNATHHECRVKGPGVVTGRSGSLGVVMYVEDDFWPLNTTLWVKQFIVGSPMYAFFVLRSIDLAGFNSGSAVPTLNRNDIHGLPVVRPSPEVLARFDDVVGPILSLKERLVLKNANLRTTRDLLLPKLISGELDVSTLPEPQAETA